MLADEAAVVADELAPDARIDSHVHLWREAPDAAQRHPQFPGDDRSFLPEHLAPILARSRFDAALVVTCGTTEAERLELASWVAAHSCLYGLVAGWSDDLPESRALAALHQQGKLRGIWVRWPGASPGSLAGCHAALAFCESRQLALEVNPEKEQMDLAAVHEVIQGATVPVVLGMFAGAPRNPEALTHWMQGIRPIAASPRAFVKLSGLYADPMREWPLPVLQALIRVLLEIFGSERLMFGSGWPFSLPAHSWKECLARFTQALGPRDQAVREHLLGAAAQRAYGRPRHAAGDPPIWKC